MTKAKLKADARTKVKIEKAFAERPVKSNRGRKSINLDEYVQNSIKKIIEYEELLIELKKEVLAGTKSKRSYDILYNKKTALQSRLNKKTQKIKAQQIEQQNTGSFKELSLLLS